MEEILNLSEKYIVNKPIFKYILNQKAKLNTQDRKDLTKYITNIRLYAQFKEDNIRIPPYIDDKKEYLEVQILTISLKENNLNLEKIDKKVIIKPETKINRILDIIFRFIPYPQLIITKYENYIQLHTTHIRNHEVDPSKITIDEIISTSWINVEDIGEQEENLFENIKIENHDKNNMYTFYKTYVDSITHYNASKRVDKNVKLDNIRIKEINDEIEKLEKKLKKLRQELKRETQPPKEVKLNNEIREVRMRLKELNNELKNN